MRYLKSPEFKYQMYIMYLKDASNTHYKLNDRIYWMKLAIKYKRLYNEAISGGDA